MKISHIAIWCNDLEKERDFYEKYFKAQSGAKYVNKAKQFESYFLEFESGARLELMHKPNVAGLPISTNVLHLGLAHLAFAAKSREEVDVMTENLRAGGCYIAGEPRITGDGYYESIILDPEGNLIEICFK